MPLILGTNSIKDTTFNVANSCRFDDGSSDYLVRSLGSQSSLRIGTFSFWIKFSQLTVNRQLYSNEVENDNNRGYIQLTNTDELRIVDNDNSGTHIQLKTNRKLRDVSAWYHIVIRIDTTQSTSTDRVRVYINGVQETSFAQTDYPSQNDDLKIFEGGQTNKNLLGSGYPAGSSYIDGYICEFVYCDGQSLDPTSFGEFDSDSPNVWKPIDVSGLTFGNNGFYLDFEDSSALGKDVSGNSNNFTVNNLTSVDQSTDTCTNNFATLNPLTNTRGTSQNFKEGNLQIDGTGSGAGASASTISTSTSGKYYIECKIDSLGSGYAEFFAIATSSYANHTLGYFETNTDTILWNLDYRSGQSKIRKDGSSIITTPTSFSNGDIIGMAIDVDNGKIYFHRNGTYVNYSGTQNPSSGSNGITLPTSSDGYLIAASVDNNSGSGTTLTMNFGSPSFSISSGNSDGNGYGNFEYSVPSGYYSLCTKNLAEFG